MLGYDLNGNVTSRTDVVHAATTTLTWDGANRLLSASNPSVTPTTVSYGYDLRGLRTSRTAGTNSTGYLYDTAGGVPRTVADFSASGSGANLTWTLNQHYDWAAGNLFAQKPLASAVLGLHPDYLGSVSFAMSGPLNSWQSRTYDAWGGQTQVGGADNHPPSPFGFTGESQEDPASAAFGLVYLRGRCDARITKTARD